MIPVLVIAGPTASGKTALAVELARRLGGEVISADSRQVYRGMDLGTAKPTARERELATHHLLDRVEPAESYNAGRFVREAAPLIEELHRRGRVPILCGGTGFYLGALLEPLFEEPPVDPQRRRLVREELDRQAQALGRVALHEMLARVDPASAARLHPHDLQRVGRALELYRLTGRTMTELLAEEQPPRKYAPLTVILEPERGELKERIARRARAMLEQGWPEEVRRLLASGVRPEDPGMQSLGYREVAALVRGEAGFEQTLESIIRWTWQYARRQLIWFRQMPAVLREDPAALAPERIIPLWDGHREQLERSARQE